MIEKNVKLTMALEEAFNARDWERLGRTLAESVVVHDPANPKPVRGREAVLQMFREFVGHFPTARIEGARRFGEGDWVCSQNVETGTQKEGDRDYRIDTCYVFRVENEELTEIHFYYDALGMMTQLGMAPGVPSQGPG